MDVKGKVVVITGGAGGLGKAFTKSFLGKGAKVCICDISIDAGNKALEEFRKVFGNENIRFSKCDVTSDEDFEASFAMCEAEFGTVDILINNAGIYNDSNWNLAFNINLGGTIRGSELAMKKMGKHNGGKGGSIINIASIAGLSPFYLAPFYSASKGGVTMYTRSLGTAFHYAYSGVTIQCLCPYLVETPLIYTTVDQRYNDFVHKALDIMSGKFPRQLPEEVSEALFKLLHEQKNGAALVTGKDIVPYYAEPSVADFMPT